MKDFHQKSKQELMSILNVTSKGLNNKEVQKQREKYGLNQLQETAKKTTLQVFLEQFKDLLVIILLFAASISMFLGNSESPIVIFSVVLLNAILGTMQHIKAEQSLNSLKALSAPTAKVLRNGEKIEISSKEVVVGDILYLDTGDYVSADGRIIENYSLQVNESSLTGESESVLKTDDIIKKDNVTISDKKNMAFSGSLVTYGRASILVTSVGMDTELGKVAELLENTKEKRTPLQVNLDNFSKKLAAAILIICVIVFGLNMHRGYAFVDSFIFAVALAVAAIPEALSSIVTIVLSLGTQKIAKENAIVRKLQTIESLGNISIICSDKTGTLTQNKMTVKKIYIDNKILDYNELNPEKPIEKKLILMSLLCNDAITIENKEIGDPTEVALVNLGDIYNLDELTIRKNYPRLDEITFDSERKLMSTVHNISEKTLMVTKGALDVLLSKTVMINSCDGIKPITPKDIENIEKTNEKFSKNGLRVLAFAYKEINTNKSITIDDENNLIFVGLIAMMDPPREESAKAIADCISAGIKPIMITGDHKITASAIAKQIGILKQDSRAIEGHEIDKMSDKELKQKVENISVYARVSPEHKIRIVRAWQEKGNIVAMTGDGVNDAPALKQADIGIAMGITGTEVAKDAASMILTDDNFSTIVKAISNGRNIYSNIKNSIKFLLSGNIAGILSVLYASLTSLPVPFAPVHLLFINLLTDSLPAIALGLEPNKKEVMREPPRDVSTPILNKTFGINILFEGLLISICSMTAFHIGLNTGDKKLASTMAFSTLCLARLIHGFNSRSKESIFKIGLFSNKYLCIAFSLGFVLLNSVLLFNPLKIIFEVSYISLRQILAIYGLSLTPFITIQTYKSLFPESNTKTTYYKNLLEKTIYHQFRN
ncbi:cation-translocating P-type ATPase [Clostridium brassicae]|uniref:Cation-translocating P-type ATPase n=1 Tax=Clostridium brassicae TaxID=2999072 RepID=A0ABT4DA56_9CLOT|nr:cation-translocating P-type ATPase [Clostridium brassicae]MCY6958086.1 cation-translocating P-type ATPase [Clostridium brassicae]